MADFGVAGSAVGVISLGIQVCQGLLQYYGSWKDAHKDVAKMCKIVEDLADTLKVLEGAIQIRSVDGEVEANVQNSIGACVDGIKDMQEDLIKVQKINGTTLWSKLHGHGRRLLYPFRESTLLKLKENVFDIRENLNLALSVLHLQVTAKAKQQPDHVSSQMQSLISHNRDQESQAILDWLSPLNFFVTQNDILSRRQDGTGDWLFATAEFKAWLSGKEKILYCSGLPGAGKTILASTIIDRLETELPSDSGVAFIYCNYKEQQSHTLRNLVASLAQQLAYRNSIVPDVVRDLYNSHKARKTRPGEADYSTVLRSLVADFLDVYVIVDALDECNEDNRTRSKLINELLESEANLHLLCTSRYLGAIEKSFAGVPHLEIRASNSDVRSYLQARILDDNNLSELCERDGSLQGVIVEKLTEKADGMFLLAKLHVESLAGKTSPKKVRKALDNLPEELGQTYEEAINRIRNQDNEKAKLGLRMLTWIAYSLRPMKIGEVRHAIGIMDLEPDENCLDEEDLPSEALMITASGIFLKAARKNIPECTVRYISSLYPVPFNGSFYGRPCNSYSDMRDRLRTYKLLKYASDNWGNHARGNVEHEIEEVALRLLNETSSLASIFQVMGFYDDLWYRYRYKFPRKVSGILVASTFGLAILVDKLFKTGNSIDAMGCDDFTALHEAARGGHDVVVQLLIDNGANIEAKDLEGDMALHKAAINGREVVVELLLDNGANLEARDDYRRMALHLAVEGRHEAVAQLLLNKGANIEAKDMQNWTALHWAARRGHNTVVQLLLDAGANTEAKDRRGQTVLHTAALNGHKAVMQLLLDNGANLEASDDYEWTALHMAAKAGHEAVAQLLLNKGANIEAKDIYNWTALHRAARRGHIAMVELLLDNGANIEARGSLSKTALHEAADKGHKEVAQLLRDRGADFEAKDSYGNTALYLYTIYKKGNQAIISN